MIHTSLNGTTEGTRSGEYGGCGSRLHFNILTLSRIMEVRLHGIAYVSCSILAILNINPHSNWWVAVCQSRSPLTAHDNTRFFYGPNKRRVLSFFRSDFAVLSISQSKRHGFLDLRFSKVCFSLHVTIWFKKLSFMLPNQNFGSEIPIILTFELFLWQVYIHIFIIH